MIFLFTKKEIMQFHSFPMDIKKSTITLTFGDRAENHVGMQQIGKMVSIGRGFHLSDLKQISTTFESIGNKTELFDLGLLSDIDDYILAEAYVLVIRNGINAIYEDLKLDTEKYNSNALFNEQASLDIDKKTLLYGRIVNKHARWNLCFDEKAQEPDYQNSKGRIISFENIPLTNTIIQSFPTYFGQKAVHLKGEGNYYYDIKKCGIGFHGDSERRKVIAIRLGQPLDIHFQWFFKNHEIGKRIMIPLEHGDIYLMSEKAVGTDWKEKLFPTLRHATGAKKYIL